MARKTTLKLLSTLSLVFLVMLFAGCVKDAVKQTRTYTIITPVYKERTEVMAAINGNPSQNVDEAGKLYIKDHFIYLNEVNKGVHIIDNSNPSSPKQVAFLNIPGNLDIAVRGNILYADMYSDLLAIDISNPKNVTVTKTITGFFQSRMYYYGTYQSDNSKVIVDWIKKDTTVELSGGYGCPDCYGDVIAFQNATSSVSKSSTGTAGSMASMVLMDDYLYALREAHSVGIVNISDPSSPRHDTTMFAGFDLETIYPFEGKLFLGSMTGMFMYDVSNPVEPVKLGEFSHGRACDPVVTDGNYAYVTLHAGSFCGGSSNELNVVNIKDLMNPMLVRTYELTKPTGLCKDGNVLFVCDETSGVRVFDAANPADLKQLKQIPVQQTYDVIATNKRAMIVAKDALYQYDYSDLNNIRQLSVYTIKR